MCDFIIYAGCNMFTQDESNYLRGLLILAGIDSTITEKEKEFVMSVGLRMGFNREFCSEALESILQNEYIDQTIPVFTDPKIAENFLQDCYRLALVDNDPCFKEISWLNNAAIMNNLLPFEFIEKG